VLVDTPDAAIGMTRTGDAVPLAIDAPTPVTGMTSRDVAVPLAADAPDAVTGSAEPDAPMKVTNTSDQRVLADSVPARVSAVVAAVIWWAGWSRMFGLEAVSSASDVQPAVIPEIVEAFDPHAIPPAANSAACVNAGDVPVGAVLLASDWLPASFHELAPPLTS
jgi:hypothetical protein